MKGYGSFAKGRNRNPIGEAPVTYHGGKVYQDSGWDLETNGRSLAKNVHLHIEFTRYGECGIAAKRRAVILYNRPLSIGGITSSITCKGVKAH